MVKIVNLFIYVYTFMVQLFKKKKMNQNKSVADCLQFL